MMPIDTSIIFHSTQSAILDVAWSYDSRYLACSAVGGTIFIVDGTSGRIITTYRSFDHRSGSLLFSPDGRLLARPGESGIEIWNILTHEHSFVNLGGRVVQASAEPLEEGEWSLYDWSPDGKQIAARLYGSSEDAVRGTVMYVGDPKRRAWHEYYTLIQIWESESFWASHAQRLYRTLVLVSGSDIGPGISCVSWSPDGETLAIGQGTLVHLWRPRTDHVVATYSSGIKQGPKYLWELFNEIADIDCEIANINHVHWSPDGLFLACIGDVGIEIWEVATGEKLATYYEHVSAIVDIKWLMDKGIIISVDQDDIHLWHFRDGRVLQKVSIPYPKGEEESALFTAALAPDLSALACVGYKGKVPLTEEVEGIMWLWMQRIEGMVHCP